ncbi:MAG: inorganic phosphate transporter [Promethearchaeota archaeon]|nr:MAG: inorganic phosphate transporter [Candidatus Lokiarchaeota archaeon]
MAFEYELAAILVVVLIVLAIGLAFSIGANDETTAPLAAAGTLRFKFVLIIGGAAIAFGTIFLSEGVASLVGQKILGSGIRYTVFMLLAVLISAIVWLIIGSFAGIPLSSTHSLIGSIFGVVIVYAMFSGGVNPEMAFNWEKLGGVVLSWFLSPLFGLLGSYLLYKIIDNLYLSKKKGLNEIEKSERNFAWALLFAIIFAEIWVGANSAEALGILYALYTNGNLTIVGYYFFVVICALIAFLGLFIAGRYVIRNLASQLTDARPSDGFIIQLASSIILMFCTVIFCVPVSHSHVIVFCIIGMNLAKKKEVDYGKLGKMFLFWVLTFPVAAILAGLIYFGFISFGMI